MTQLAFGAKLPLVLVILSMTVETVQRRLAKTFHISVTRFADYFHLGMRILQLKTCLRMVKPGMGQFPTGVRMTTGAVGTQSRLMFVIFLVAGKAIFACGLEHYIFVAVFAFRLCVLSIQWKT